ncbi:MAG TPA: gamma-glutamyl-gamma-aminobutyrate hydrolase family protein, partial [Opitutales bacterium]|nr:gamma-glutamyl-gamma-aminobutyrate hydrolase family protein [Opitutales bacterium]
MTRLLFVGLLGFLGQLWGSDPVHELPQTVPICYDAVPRRWELVRLMELGGVEAVIDFLDGRPLVGVVSVEGLYYARLMDVADLWMHEQPDLVIAYVTPELVLALGPQVFAGLVLPGGAAHYPPCDCGAFLGLNELEAYSPFPNEAAYRQVLPWAQLHHVPVLAICLGAQQVGLFLGAQLERVGCEDCHEPVRVLEGGVLAEFVFESLQPNAQWALDVRRIHRFAVRAATLPEGARVEAVSALGTLMAFSYEDWLLAIQFHPEACYEGLAVRANRGPCDSARNTALLRGWWLAVIHKKSLACGLRIFC